jgi:hypothetical protein
MAPHKPLRTHYSETEAARELGVTLEEFRKILRTHIVDKDEELKHSRKAMFQASDLLVLRLLTGRTGSPTTVG